METKWLVIDYWKLNKWIPKVQTTQAKFKGRLALIETAKIDHIWWWLWGTKYFSILDIHSAYHHISIHPDSRPKTAFTCPYGKFQWERVAFGMQTAPSISLNLMLKLFPKYLDECLVFCMDDLLIYSQTEEEHLKHLELVFEKFREAGIKLKMSKYEFLRKRLTTQYTYCQVKVSPQSNKKSKQLLICPCNKCHCSRHIISLVGYYRKFLPILVILSVP